MMKNNLKAMLTFALTFLVLSCKEAPKKAEVDEKKNANTEQAEKKNTQDQLLERLKKTTPVNVDDLKAWLPKNLGGLSLERAKSFSLYKESQMTGTYKRKGDKIISIYITDAAGPNGTMAADKINVYGTEREYDIENQQHRSVNVKGRMARQIYVTDKNMTTLLFFHKKRFMIMITAHDHNVEETWGLVDELDFNALDQLIN